MLPSQDIYLGNKYLRSETYLAGRQPDRSGYLDRKHGLGTFVTGLPAYRHSLDMTVSYTEMIREAGMKPGETVVSRAERPAPDEDAGKLGIAAGELLVYIERVRTADGVPAMLSSEWHVPGTFELPVYRRPLAGGGG